MKYKSIGIFIVLFLSILYVQNFTIVNSISNIVPQSKIQANNSNHIQTNNLFSVNDFSPLPSLTTHSPITILGDNQISLYSSTGTGTSSDPYVISNLNITSASTYLFDIVNTSKPLIIKDNFLNGINAGSSIGFNLRNASNIMINNNEIINTFEGIDASISPHLSIENNYIHFLNVYGYDMLLDYDNYSLVEYNNLSVSQGFAIELGHSFYDTIQNNNLVNAQVAIYSINTVFSKILNNSIALITDTGIDLEFSNESIVQSNSINIKAGAGINLNSAYDKSVSNNNIVGTSVAFFETFSNNDTFTSNVILNPVKDAFSLISSNNSVIKDNSITNIPLTGIFLSLSNQNKIISNTLTGNSDLATGIYLEVSNFNFISTNTIGSFFILLQLVNSNWNNMTDLTFLKSSGNQTELISSNFNVISKSNFDSSGNYGLTITGGIDNKVLLNTFQNSKYYSLFITNGQSAIIEKNDFFGVPHYGDSQAFDNGTNSLFRFNYWQGYTSPDSNKDGFVDYPFLIDGPSQSYDKYPLVSATQIYNVFTIIINNPINLNVTTGLGLANNSNSTQSSGSKASPGFTIDLLFIIIPIIGLVSLIKRKKTNI